MKTTLQKVKDGIAAALQGRTVEELAEDEARANLAKAAERFLVNHPDWKPTTKSAPAVAPVKKSKRIMKSLGAGAGIFTPHVVDEEALRRAREAARAFQAADPDRYSHIIESAPLRGEA
ncbi:hypothetical protein ACQEL9_004409 [Raoultella planticola]